MTADAASCWTLSAFILTLEKSEPKIWMHTKHCLSSAKAIPIQEAQRLHCVDAAASDAENLCKGCLDSPVDIFWWFLFRILWNDSARRIQYARDILFSHSTVEKEFFIRAIEICNKQELLIKSCRYWLLNRQTKGGKLISDPFSSKALATFTYSRCTSIRGNDIIASGMRHQQKF